MGIFLEPFIVIGLFAKTPFLIRLAEDSQCKLQMKEYATLVRRTRRGTPTDELKEERRWKGESQPIRQLTVPDEEMAKRIRGVTFSTRVPAQFENAIINAAHFY
ncbi:RNA 3'-terminal phosphate cyclase [Melia azedarach]|uniref:RNA 3'-terminal phosphate cyclase n=1 Tax=Melia azedarach TaxID=155640 RepID=A0ACC1YMF6_MELAZ|nr:RNA 3'-terminal phosphate cyclase [Melia azedarach]